MKCARTTATAESRQDTPRGSVDPDEQMPLTETDVYNEQPELAASPGKALPKPWPEPGRHIAKDIKRNESYAISEGVANNTCFYIVSLEEQAVPGHHVSKHLGAGDMTGAREHPGGDELYLHRNAVLEGLQTRQQGFGRVGGNDSN